MDFPNISVNFKEIVIDEIALEGLQGIGIKQLWIRMKIRLSSEITEKMQSRLWNFIRGSDSVLFYKSPDPAPYFDIIDRFSNVDGISGQLTESNEYIDGPHTHCLVPNEMGSCSNYSNRVQIPKEKIQKMLYSDVIKSYGDNLVMVAPLDVRWHALAPYKSLALLNNITPQHYCILELIGKARQNGQVSVGKSHLKQIFPEPKSLFYAKKVLKKHGLIETRKVNYVGQKHSKTILIRLKRFHRPKLGDVPHTGVVHNMTEYLKARPDYSEYQSVLVKEGLMTSVQAKRLSKSSSFKFGEEIPMEGAEPKKRLKVKNRKISLIIESEESSSSSDEEEEEPVKCEYKIGVDLLRQAYERLMETGTKGLTIIQLAKVLGVEFYTARSISKIYKRKKVLREVWVDRGRQRIARLVAVTATGTSDAEYAREKRKLQEYLDTSTSGVRNSAKNKNDETEVPKKKIKLEKDSSDSNKNEENQIDDIKSYVVELKTIKGVEKESRSFDNANLTLRQVRLGNALLKLTQEQLAIPGFQVLSSKICKETGEPPMDNKSLKRFTMRFMRDGHVRVFQIKWPGFEDRETTMICASHVTINDAIIKAKVKEISLRASLLTSKHTSKNNKNKNTPTIKKNLLEYRYPKYMKAKKLHEFLTQMVYFSDITSFEKLPAGCAYLINIIPEMTVEFAMGNMQTIDIPSFTEFNINDSVLNLKLRDAPQDIREPLLLSSGLKNSLRTNLQILAMFGLIQLISQSNKETSDVNSPIFSYLFYVNRCAKVVNTTGVWPREVVDVTSLEQNFTFNSFEDVQNYWNIVYNISLHTKMRREVKKGKHDKNKPPLVKLNSIVKDKPCDLLGDGKGPCGFDSAYYLEFPRFWSTQLTKRTFKFKPSIPDHLKMAIIPKIKKKHLKKKKKTRSKVDKALLTYKKAPELPVNWTEREDKILNMLRVAMAVMNSTPQAGSLRARNLSASSLILHLTKDKKKTPGKCHTRFIQLEGNAFLNYEKQQLLSEIRRHKNIVQPYEGFFKKLKYKSLSEKQTVEVSRLKMLELLWIVDNVAQNKSFEKFPPCVAVDYKDFQNKFSLSLKCDRGVHTSYGNPNDSIRVGLLKEVMMCSINSSYFLEADLKNVVTMYSILTKYPEGQLREAMDHLKDAAAIALKEKTVYNYTSRSKFKSQDLIKIYKPCTKYLRRWANSNADFITNLYEKLILEASTVPCSGTSEIICLLSEMLLRGILEIVCVSPPTVIAPPNALLPDDSHIADESKLMVKSGTVGFYLKERIEKFADLYKNCHIFTPEEICASVIISSNIQTEVDITDIILSNIREKNDDGVTLQELQETCNLNYSELITKLTQLEQQNVIKRVGYYVNKIAHIEFLKQRTIKSKECTLIPVPWVTVCGNLIPIVFINWAGTILNETFKHPGVSIATLSSLCELITYKAVHEICEFLLKSECVYMKIYKSDIPDLFSEDNEIQSWDYNPFEDFTSICVFPVADAMARFAYVRQIFHDKYVKQNSAIPSKSNV